MTAAPLGSFEEHVLLATLRLQGVAYGMRVRREIETCTGRAVAIGAVYATLDRLESKGLVASRRCEVEARSRRVFEVTAEGVSLLELSRTMREALWRWVDLATQLSS